MYCTSHGQTGPAGVGTSNKNVFWLKADKGTSTTTNSTSISFWNDQSGNAINVTQTIATQQPSFCLNVMNGFPAIQFDNVSTTNDKLLGPDSPSLDSTTGYSFFMVSRPQNVDGNARVIVSKRTTVAVDQSFMHFYYSGNNFYTDIETNNDRYNTAATFASNNNYLIDQFYDGSLAAASRCKTYISSSLNVTAAETSTLVPNNASPILIGSTDATDTRPFGGYIAEVIIYTVAVNDPCRIIVDNYLSAKYNIALLVNDKYLGDNAGNGNYDYEVAGIGKDATGSNPSFSASICAGLGISSTGIGLDNTDYLLAGHASFANAQVTVDVGGMTGINNARWLRIWYIDVTNVSTNINTNIEFDMSDGGVAPVTLGVASDYVLLYRAAQVGNWTELVTGSAIVGDRVQFNGYDLVNDGYYTIGTRNYLVSPLPIELINFDAIMNGKKVDITWTTLSEKNNEGFEIEKSKDGINFEVVSEIKGALNSDQKINYSDTDFNPYEGISYYRLKQTDVNGKKSYSQLVAVNFKLNKEGIRVYPNPTNGEFNIDFSDLSNSEVLVVIRDASGREFFSKVFVKQENGELIIVNSNHELTPGTYLVTASSENKLFSTKVIVK